MIHITYVILTNILYSFKIDIPTVRKKLRLLQNIDFNYNTSKFINILKDSSNCSL